MTSPRITVALSVYNNAEYLADALDSILAQTFGDFELVIVDDGSTDHSPPSSTAMRRSIRVSG
ncbi:hypothetical protein GCM10020258_20490 [Sphingomonas yabuuchiae]